MKILMKIYLKYFVMSILIVFVFLAVELGILVFLGTEWSSKERYPLGGRAAVEEIAEDISIDEQGRVTNSRETAQAIRATGASWSMLLSGTGEILWEEGLPDHLNHSYSAGEIALFSRWYLDDCPVVVWKLGEKLFVAGYPEGSFVRYNNIMRQSDLMYYVKFLIMCLAGAALLAVLLILLMGFLYYRKMRSLIQAIVGLSKGESVVLSRKESFGEVASYINEASRKLNEQQQMLRRRDESRTEWISGVSHDIRTPLAIVMGNAELIEEREDLDPQVKKMAAMMKEQSLRIRSLIEDLNLTSKLAYHMQPVRKKEVSPAALLRKAVASCMNQLQDQDEEKYPIELSVSEEFQKKRLEADEHLLLRALENVIGNAVRHNPEGCHLRVNGFLEGERCMMSVEDDGRGIPQDVVSCLNEGTETARHIMGLRIVRQIMEAHGGWMKVLPPSKILLVI